MTKPPPTLKIIFFFWIPLALTWLLMSIEGPYLAAIIARLGDTKHNLAAYGVAYAIALVVEAPIIMLMSASTALVKNWQSFIKLRQFTTILNIAITVIMILLVIPDVFDLLVIRLIGLPPGVDRLTHMAVILLLPWPAAIGFRRFYQGLLIRAGLTRRVTIGTVVRLIAMSVTAASLYVWNRIPGAYVGALALSAGVVCESIAIRFLVNGLIKSYRIRPREDKSTLSFPEIIHFYYPLALMTFIGLGAQSLLTFFVARGRYPLESLAVLPVIHSLVFLFRSMGLSYQEVIIAFLNENRKSYKVLRKFAGLLSMTVTIGLGLVVFTDAAHFWFRQISHLSEELSQFAILPSRILVLLPAMSVIISFQRGVMVYMRKTIHVTIATVIEVSGILTLLSIVIFHFNWIGILAASTAVMAGRLLANVYLYFPVKRSAIDSAASAD